jgi:alkyl sulfatase BDS1-like metallo-beta-lactamase superfamily hydrolase
MGGASAILQKAQASYDAGDYRWVVEVVNHIVYADPSNQAAKNLQADALEQLGYQAESGPWRNFYLSGAQELRNGVASLPTPNTASPDIIRAMSLDLLFDFLGVRLDGPKAFGKEITINLKFTDLNEEYVVFLENAALNHSPNRQDPNADATITVTREMLNKVLIGETTIEAEVASGQILVNGSQTALPDLLGLLVDFKFWFNIVTPETG